MLDIHNHSKFSFDSVALPEDEINKAKEKGVKIYGFAEHVYLFDNTDLQEVIGNLRQYVDYIDGLKSLFPNIQLLHGAEYNFDVPHENEYNIISDSVTLDYVVNSVHWLDGLNMYDNLFSKISVEKAYDMYLDSVLKSIDAGYDYQIIGHFGSILKIGKQFSPKEYFDKYESRIAEILTKIIEKGKTLEVNTSCDGVALSFPSEEVLKLYYSLGGRKISFGADAHTVSAVAHNIALAVAAAKKIGFTYATYFESKQEKRYFFE